MCLTNFVEDLSGIIGKKHSSSENKGRVTYSWGGYPARNLVVRLTKSNNKFRYNFSYQSIKCDVKKSENKRLIDNLYQDLLEDLGFVSNTSGSCAYYADSPEELLSVAQQVDLLLEDEEYFEVEEPVSQGVSFAGTQFSRLRERGATISPKFMKHVCAASGMVLENTMAEYQHLSGGQIDGVETDEDDKVISLYECQSGIHEGEYLDDEHANKIISQYFLGDHHTYTVKKFVLLAGGYKQKHLNMFQQWIAMHPDREIYLLRTNRQNDRIGVEVVDVFKSEDPAPRYANNDTDLIEVGTIIDRLDNLQQEQNELKDQLRAYLEKQNTKKSLMKRLFR